MLVIGLDGGTEAVLGLPDANLPHIAELRRAGASCVLRSTIPPITAAAWASMMTGWNPGRHGMYDFRRLAIERYTRLWSAGHSAAFTDGRDFVTSRRWAGSAIWDLAGNRGRVAVLSVPMTYPAWEVNGALVAGFPLPDYERNHTYPADLAERLPPLLRGADRLKRMSDDELAAYCLGLIDEQRRIVLDWLASGDYELVVAVFQSTDFAQHRLWKYLDIQGHPLREALLEMYRAIDRLVGDGRAALGAEGTVAVVSDHGFGPHPRTFMRTDAILAAAGLLSTASGSSATGSRAAAALRRAPAVRRALRLGLDRLPRGVGDWAAGRYTGASEIEWAKTQAYRISLYAPAEGVVVNLKGRQEEGVVEPGAEYERVRDAVIEALLEVRTPSGTEPVIQWAGRREDLYRGPYAEEAPDVVALLDPGFKGAGGVGEVFEPVPDSLLAEYSGVHAMDGIFAVAGPGVRPGVALGVREIVDVAPTLLTLLGIPVPAEVDGAAMTEALHESTIVETSVRSREGVANGGDPALTSEEKLTLEESLRALGYLE